MGDTLDKLVDGLGAAVGDGVETAGQTATGLSTGGASAGAAVGTAARDTVGAALESRVEEFLWGFTQSAVDGTQVVFHFMIDLLLDMTAPQITGEFIYTMGGRLFYISLPLVVLFAAIRIIVDSMRARALAGAQAAFLGAGASVLGTVALLPLTALAVRAVDAVADGLLAATLADGDEFVDGIMTAIVQFGTVVGNMVEGNEMSGPVEAWAVPAGGAMATVIICLGCVALLILACFIVGMALIARNMLLYLVTVTGPVCLSGLAWEPTRRWASIWLGWMVALIFTKLAIVVALGLGVLSISTPWISEGSSNVLPILATVLAGILMLILAAFMPVAAFALFGFLGEAGVRELSNAAVGAQGTLTSVAESTLHAGQSAKDRLGSVLEKGGPGDGGGGRDPGLVHAPTGSGDGDGTGSEQRNGDGPTGGRGSGGPAAAGALESTAGTTQTTTEADGETTGVTGAGAGSDTLSGAVGSEGAEGEPESGLGEGSEMPGAGPSTAAGVPSAESSDGDVPYSWEQPAEADLLAPGPVQPPMDPPVTDPPDEEGVR